MSEHNTHQELYFGATIVYFRECEGEAGEYSADALETKSEFTQREKNRFSPQEHLGPDYSEFVVPGIPAPDIVRKESARNSTKNIPPAIARPLIKTSHETDVRGYQSGARSAVIHIGDKYYRLKGCGNLDQGITIKRRTIDNKDFKDREFSEVRGCMFEQTCFRELSFTEHVNNLLLAHNKHVANVPLGFYQYTIPGDTSDKIKKFCGLFETFSDRRLGDHVIVGLEMLLPKIVKEISREDIQARFPPARVQDGVLSETWVSLLMDEYANKLNLCVHGDLVAESGDIGAAPVEATGPFKQAWDDNSSVVQQHLPLSGNRSLLALLYWRLGYEAGYTQQLMVNNNVSWATYEDLLGFHCNAHPNNFVLLPPSIAKTAVDPLLAPLDFDMAFNISDLDQSFPTKKDDWMNVEKGSLVLALAGDESLNSGATGTAELDPSYTVLKWALRDTLVLGFNAGLQKEPDAHPLLENQLPVARALLELALIMTSCKIS